MKFTIYAYLFAKEFNKIFEYEISLNNRRYQVSKKILNQNHEQEGEESFHSIHDTKGDAVKSIIDELSSMEQRANGSNEVIPNTSLLPLIKQIEESIEEEMGSITIIGSIKKYHNQKAAREFMEGMGYKQFTSRAPEFYVLDEFIN